MSALVDRDEIARLSDLGLTTYQIADRLGCSERTVGRARIALGIATGRRQASPVTPERLAAAERMLEEGMSLTDIKRELHMGNSSTRRYLHGRGWSKRQTGEYAHMVKTLNKIEPFGSVRNAA